MIRAAIKAVARAYKTYFARSAGGSADNYSVDHTGFIYVVGPDGRYRGFLPPQLAPDRSDPAAAGSGVTR